MRNAALVPVYNSRIHPMHAFQHGPTRAACFLLLIAFCVPGYAANWTEPEAQLARKIAAATGPGVVSVEFVDKSSLTKAESEEVHRGIVAQLGGMGVHIANADQAAATVHITFSEDLRDYVWTAKIRMGGNESSVVMVSTPRPDVPAIEREAALVIHKTSLWAQAERILDVATIGGNPGHMLVLSAETVTLYKFQDSRWQLEQTLAINHARPWPRDLRGKLVTRKDRLFDAYLPGVLCHSSGNAPLTLTCAESDDPWPIGTDQFPLGAFFASTRNFFTGAVRPAIGTKTAPPFYSTAALPREKYTLWVLAAVDGQVHMLDGFSDQSVSKLGWGSDIAGVHSGCGPGWQVLATNAGSGTDDSIRAYELADREAVPVSRPVEFSGSITALWTEPEGNSAVVVVRNTETGRHEAFRLNLTCGQ